MDWTRLYELARGHLAGADRAQLAIAATGALMALAGTLIGGYRAARLALRVAGWLLLPVATLAGGVLAWAFAGPKLSQLARGVLAEIGGACPELAAGCVGVSCGHACVVLTRRWLRRRVEVYFAGDDLTADLSRADRRAVRRLAWEKLAEARQRRRELLTRKVWAARDAA